MDFKDSIKQLSERATKLKQSLQTEESVKNSLILPFIQALGYDVFNPFEVIPEFTCDIGTKKGEKIDYAIQKDGKPIILIECKHWSQALTLYDNQLLRYFHVSTAKFGVLTNGLVYKFYTDLEHENKMDEKPFLELNIEDIKPNEIEELKQFHKSYFDVETIVNAASELKYMKGLRDIILSEMENPSEPLVRMFAKQVYEGLVTAKIIEQFTDLTKRTFKQVVSDIITERFKTAIDKEKSEQTQEETLGAEEIQETAKIETTEEEKEAFYIVKSILRKVIDMNRIFERDTQSYFNILLDDSNRKPICRLYLNGTNKYLATLDQNKKETKHLLSSLDDIYTYEKEICEMLKTYE
ncbi:MAG: type I restriction endonuclease [Petrimonas sp.]|nr:type I restriction endonuclease [Petrimonas sp.]